MRKTIYNIIICCIVTLLSACTASVPKESKKANAKPEIYPDYTDIIIPCNIAPLNFMAKNKGEEFIVNIKYSNKSKTFKADSEGKFKFSTEEWKEMTKDAMGDALTYTLYIKDKGKWTEYDSFTQTISADSIDKYITYRLIEPLYKQIGTMGLYQYDTETAEQTTIFDYRKQQISRDYKHTYCVNCHTTQKSNPKNRLFYVRGERGGMMLTYNGKTKIVNTKSGDMKFSTAYASWHPTLPLIACTSENVRQVFPSNDAAKIYQFDFVASIMLYDAEKNEITNALRSKDKLNGMMAWSPDGEYLYYGTSDSVNVKHNMLTKLRYNIAKAKFNAADKSFGEPEMVVHATALDSSAASPKISPDGKFMMFRMGKYGMYMQTNKTADIYMLNLETKQRYSLDSINSPEADNFHDFSSNGRWILYESKKEDGNYGRVYFSYFDKDGIAHKPFAIPHANPLYDKELMKCYNCTEFTTCANDKKYQEYHTMLENDSIINANFGSPIDTMKIDGGSGASRIDGESGASKTNPAHK